MYKSETNQVLRLMDVEQRQNGRKLCEYQTTCFFVKGGSGHLLTATLQVLKQCCVCVSTWCQLRKTIVSSMRDPECVSAQPVSDVTH